MGRLSHDANRRRFGKLREDRDAVPPLVHRCSQRRSSSGIRYLVLPERPAGADNFTEEQLAALVTRDSMVGVAKALPPGGTA